MSQIGRQEWSRLSFGGGQIVADANGRVTGHDSIEQNFSRETITRGDMRYHTETIILSGDDVGALEADAEAEKFSDFPIDHDVARFIAGKPVGGVTLDFFAERGGGVIAQTRFGGFVRERDHLDRSRPRMFAIARPQVIAGAAVQGQRQTDGKKKPEGKHVTEGCP